MDNFYNIRGRVATVLLIILLALVMPCAVKAQAEPLSYQAMAKNLDARQSRLQAMMARAAECGYDVPSTQIQQAKAEAEAETKAFHDASGKQDYQAAEKEYNLAAYSYALAYGMCMESVPVEARAVFLDRKTIVGTKNDAGMAALFDRLANAGIKMVNFETNNGGFPLFNSHVVQPSKSPQLDPAYDPLAAACREAHKHNMELHAWMWSFAVGNSALNAQMPKGLKLPPDYPGPILFQHKGLELLSRQGSARPEGQNEWWMSAANPDADAFNRSFASDIITNYPIDGFVIDYIRYPFQLDGTEMGWDTISRTRFERETHLSLSNLDEHTKQEWKLWKASTVKDYVKSLAEIVNGQYGLQLNAAVYAMQEEARLNAIQQIWEPWVDNSYVNTLSPMTYAYNVQDFKVLATYVRRQCADKALPYPAIHAGRITVNDLPEALEAAREVGVLGVTFFAVDQINDDQHLRLLAEGPYRTKSVMSPSSHPVLAAQMLFDSFADRVESCKNGMCAKPILAGKDEGDAVLGEIYAIGQDLHKLKESASQADITAMIARLDNLQSDLKEWTRLELLVHRSARVDYLMLKLDNVRAVLTYGAQRARIKEAAAAKANK
jgi:uncharacterized lipoprotein YddW (UPF0748 family)